MIPLRPDILSCWWLIGCGDIQQILWLISPNCGCNFLAQPQYYQPCKGLFNSLFINGSTLGAKNFESKEQMVDHYS